MIYLFYLPNNMTKKLTQQEVETKINSLYNGSYTLISEYNGSTKPIIIKHNCGNIYEVKRAKTFLNEGNGLCPKCNSNKPNSTKRITEEEFIKRLYNQVKDEYTYISGFKNMNTKVLIKHNACGNEYYVTPHMFLGIKQRRCPKCSNKNRGKYAIREDYLEEIKNNHFDGEEYTWLEDYKNNNKLKHKIRHNKCGNEFYIRPNDFQQYNVVCPYCNSSSSTEENKIYKLIKDNYNGEIIQRYKEDNNEIDIYLPELKIGFEINGYYWHSDKFKDKNYHLNKLNYFKSKGIDIYFIDDLDINNKEKIIFSKVLHIIKEDKKEKVYARKCKVVYNLDNQIKKDFLDNNHIQGNAIDNFNLGLEYNGILVSIITFSKSRKNLNSNDSNSMELLRFANNINYRVIGSFSKLLKYSIEYIKENYKEVNNIKTFADYSLSKGNVYEKNGFILSHISKPSYYCVFHRKKYNRYQFRKTELKKNFIEIYDENLTEFQIEDKINNFYRVWNTGQLIYNLRIN